MQLFLTMIQKYIFIRTIIQIQKINKYHHQLLIIVKY